MKGKEDIVFKVSIQGPRYAGTSRYVNVSTKSFNSYMHNQNPFYITYKGSKYGLNFLEGVWKELDEKNRDISAYAITFDSTTRESYEEAKRMILQGQKINPKIPYILIATRCDLHRSLLFDAWPYVREILVSFQVGKLDSNCSLTQLNYDVITVILEFLSDASIKIEGRNLGVLFDPTRNCTGTPITKWECRQFARKYEVGLAFTSSREVINIEQSHEIILRKILYS